MRKRESEREKSINLVSTNLTRQTRGDGHHRLRQGQRSSRVSLTMLRHSFNLLTSLRLHTHTHTRSGQSQRKDPQRVGGCLPRLIGRTHQLIDLCVGGLSISVSVSSLVCTCWCVCLWVCVCPELVNASNNGLSPCSSHFMLLCY